MSVGEVKMGSGRGFGLVFVAVFAIVAGWPLLDGAPPRVWAAAVAVAFLLVALIRPALLAPLKRLWFHFGLALGRVMTPVVMLLLFVVAVIPTALALKVFRKDPMQRKLLRDAPSYWERRAQQPGPMREQW